MSHENRFVGKAIAHFEPGREKPTHVQEYIIGYCDNHHVEIMKINGHYHGATIRLRITGQPIMTFDDTWEELTEEIFVRFLDECMLAITPNYMRPHEFTMIQEPPSMSNYTQECHTCGKEFQSKRPAQTCSRACRTAKCRKDAKDSVTVEVLPQDQP